MSLQELVELSKRLNISLKDRITREQLRLDVERCKEKK